MLSIDMGFEARYKHIEESWRGVEGGGQHMEERMEVHVKSYGVWAVRVRERENGWGGGGNQVIPFS